MALQYIAVDGGSNGPEKYRRAFISRFAAFDKLLRTDHHLRNDWCWKLGDGCHGGHSTAGILKFTCNSYLGGAISSVLKVGVGGISGVVEEASARLTGSCLGVQQRVHAV